MEKIKAIFKNRPKLMIGIVVVLALSLPFVVNQVLKQQDIRQRADSAPAITFNFTDPVRTVKVGDIVTLGIILNASTNDIGALHFKLNYSADFAGNINTSISGNYTAIQQDKTNDGPFEVTLVNLSTNRVTGSNQDVMKFEFKALKAGEMKITMNEIQATASLQSQYVPVENKDNIIAKITVVGIDVPITSPTSPFSPSPICKTGASNIAVSEPCADGANRRVDYVCHDGTSGSSGDPTSCKPYGEWMTIADAACQGHESCTYVALSPTQTIATSPTPTITPTPLPTTTPIPIPTIGSDETGLKVSLALPGIGIRANLGENNAPHRGTRIATAVVYDSSNVAVTSEKTGVVTYNSTTGRYDGYISLGSSIATPSGGYIVKLKMDNTLYKRAPGIVAINKLTPNNSVPAVELVSGDITGPNNVSDNVLELVDYNLLVSCYREDAACTTSVAMLADFNDDGFVKGDDIDANILARGFYIRSGD